MIKPKKALETISKQENEPQQKWRLKLDKNENIYGALNSALSAIRNACEEDISFYPNYDKLIDKISAKYEIDKNYVLFSNGSIEAIKTIFDAYLEQDEEVLSFKPVLLSENLSCFCNFNIKFIESENKFAFDEKKLKENISSDTKIIYIETPNTHTGKTIRISEFEALIKEFSDKLFVVNCSYCSYSQFVVFEDYIDLIKKYDNVALVKSYSNDFGIAGLRFSLILASNSITNNLKKIIIPNSANSIALNCVLMILNDDKKLEEIKELNIHARELFEEILEKNNIEFYKSDSNFILCNFQNYCDFYFEKLKKQSVITKKYLSDSILKNHLRITIPTVGGVKFVGELLAKKDVLIFDINDVVLNSKNLLVSSERIEKLSQKYDLIIYSNDEYIEKLKEYDIERFFYSVNLVENIELAGILKNTPHKTIKFFSADINNIIKANKAQIEAIGVIPKESNHQMMINNYRHLGINYIMDDVNNIENLLLN